jgi:hypothetical protein
MQRTFTTRPFTEPEIDGTASRNLRQNSSIDAPRVISYAGDESSRRIQMVRGGNAVVRVLSQLRRPAASLHGVSLAGRGVPFNRRGSFGPQRILHVRLRLVRARGGIYFGPRGSAQRCARRARIVVGDCRRYVLRSPLSAPGRRRGHGRVGRGLLFSGRNVGDRGLSRRGYALARHGIPPVERLRGQHCSIAAR